VNVRLPDMQLMTVRRQRVSLAGHVVREDGARVVGGQVSVRSAAAPAKQTGGRNSPRKPTDVLSANAQRREVAVRPDGLYCFLNLAAGEYVVEGHDDRGMPLEPRPVTVPPADLTRKPILVNFDLVVAAARPSGGTRVSK